MNKTLFRLLSLTIIVILLTVVVFSVAIGGSVVDEGQINGSPSQVNYVAWVPLFTPPNEVLTEDGYNSAVGVNQGFQSGTWRLNAGNFTNPPPIPSFTINLIFGGLGPNLGSIWTFGFLWDNSVPTTLHGSVGTQASATCPVMLSGSQNGTGKTINWSGATSQYLIYRSNLPSGAGNGASNGRYALVTSIPAGTFTYNDLLCPTGTDCWHIVVPANGSGVINGCHSEESNPTAVTLTSLSAKSNTTANWLGWIVFAVLVVAIPTIIFSAGGRQSGKVYQGGGCG